MVGRDEIGRTTRGRGEGRSFAVALAMLLSLEAPSAIARAGTAADDPSGSRVSISHGRHPDVASAAIPDAPALVAGPSREVGAPPRATPLVEATADGAADWVLPRRSRVRVRLQRLAPFEAEGSVHEKRALFGAVDAATFRARDAFAAEVPVEPFTVPGIGFPHLEAAPTANRRHLRRFRPLIDWHGADVPHARVRCSNLSSRGVARRAARYVPTIERLAAEHAVPVSLIMAVIAQESCFDPGARSRAGAIGLMQLMPATARWLRAGNPWEPENNLRAGVRYLAMMHERFGTTELALAAYNAGPGNVRRYGGVPPFRETRNYVIKVLAYQRRYRALELLASL